MDLFEKFSPRRIAFDLFTDFQKDSGTKGISISQLEASLERLLSEAVAEKSRKDWARSKYTSLLTDLKDSLVEVINEEARSVLENQKGKKETLIETLAQRKLAPVDLLSLLNKEKNEESKADWTSFKEDEEISKEIGRSGRHLQEKLKQRIEETQKKAEKLLFKKKIEESLSYFDISSLNVIDFHIDSEICTGSRGLSVIKEKLSVFAEDKTLVVLNGENLGLEFSLKLPAKHKSNVWSSFSLSPNGKTALVSASNAQCLLIYSFPEMHSIRSEHQVSSDINKASFLNDESIACCTQSGELHVFEIGQKKPKKKLVPISKSNALLDFGIAFVHLKLGNLEKERSSSLKEEETRGRKGKERAPQMTKEEGTCQKELMVILGDDKGNVAGVVPNREKEEVVWKRKIEKAESAYVVCVSEEQKAALVGVVDGEYGESSVVVVSLENGDILGNLVRKEGRESFTATISAISWDTEFKKCIVLSENEVAIFAMDEKTRGEELDCVPIAKLAGEWLCSLLVQWNQKRVLIGASKGKVIEIFLTN